MHVYPYESGVYHSIGQMASKVQTFIPASKTYWTSAQEYKVFCFEYMYTCVSLIGVGHRMQG